MTWHVAYCAVRAERRAAAALTERGIEAYVPVEKHWRSHARIRDTTERPIFPRYLFFRLAGQSFYDVRQADGIETIVGSCGKPAPIPSEWVHEIRESQRAGHFDYTRTNTVTFQANDPVRIIGGPFAGMLATIIAAKPGAKRVSIFMQALGRLTAGPAEIAVADLQKLDIATHAAA